MCVAVVPSWADFFSLSILRNRTRPLPPFPRLDPVFPLLLLQRGPQYRALAPTSGQVTDLVAGSSLTVEIACHVAWTSFGTATTPVGSALDACPNNSGAFHSGDPNSPTIDDNLLGGCALGIADVDNIEDVTMDNLAVFSVQQECVKQKKTSFDIPAQLPKCTGEKCICAWCEFLFSFPDPLRFVLADL